jgi:hypothetical protein
VALSITTEQPNSVRLGSLWTFTGAASAQAALADGLDTSHTDLLPRCLLDVDVLRCGFAAPSLPANAKVYSVGVRRRIKTVPAGSRQPICVHWFRSNVASGSGSTATASTAYKYEFISLGPISADATTAWVNETIATFTTAPDGSAWDPATNLAAFTYDAGRADDYATNLSLAEVWLDITYQQRATVTITGPSTPTAGTRPAIVWTYVSVESQPQQAFRVAIYTQAQTLLGGFVPFDTEPLQGTDGYVLGDDLQWIPDDDLADGTYVAYVQAKSKWGGLGDFPTNTASYTFTRTASTGGAGTFPPNATLSSAVFDASNNRAGLTIAASSSSPNTTSFTVFASRDSGVSFAPIPSLKYITANGTTPITVYDYVAPLNVTSQYKVLAYGPNSSAPVAAAAFSTTRSVTTSGTLWWLKDPKNPLANTPIPVLAKGNKITRRRVQGTFEVLSGSGTVRPIVVNGPVYGESGTLMLGFGFDQQDLFEAWDQLDKSGHVLLLQKPTGEQLWVTLGPGAQGEDNSWEYESTNPSTVQWRKVTMHYQEVAQPDYY